MYGTMREELQRELDKVRRAGLFKAPHPISSPQSGHVAVGSRRVLNFCSNNYFGLADHPDAFVAARDEVDRTSVPV